LDSICKDLNKNCSGSFNREIKKEDFEEIGYESIRAISIRGEDKHVPYIYSLLRLPGHLCKGGKELVIRKLFPPGEEILKDEKNYRKNYVESMKTYMGIYKNTHSEDKPLTLPNVLYLNENFCFTVEENYYPARNLKNPEEIVPEIARSAFIRDFSALIKNLSLFHSNKIYHGHLNPSNIKLGSKGYMIITDFSTLAPYYKFEERRCGYIQYTMYCAKYQSPEYISLL
jgi:serine/threonine protein kinase